MSRTRRAGVTLLALGGVLLFQAAFASAGTAQEPPGNNSTVKIVDTDIDDVNDENSANHPHVTCDFSLRWYGYDEGTRTTSVSFEAQAPSGSGAVATLIGPANPWTFSSPGGGGVLDHEEPYRLDTTGLVEQQNQGFHIKVTVTTDGSKGNDTKSKVFWLNACAEPTESPTPTPSESPSESPTPTPEVSATETETPSISPSVQGVKIVKPQLPFTGPSKTTRLAVAGALMVLLGSAMLLPRRRGAHQQ